MWEMCLLSEKVSGVRMVRSQKNIAPKEQLELLELARMAGNGSRDRGTGRPTKKDRREIESFISTDYDDMFDSLDDDEEDE